MKDLKFSIFSNGKNKKVGEITQIYADKKTCPSVLECPFKACNGCYGQGFTLVKKWENVNLTLDELKQKLYTMPISNIIRYGVVGDLCKNNTGLLNIELINKLMNIFKNHTLYAYTHCNIYNPDNLNTIKNICKKNFKINVSCETLEKVNYCKNNNLSCVMAVQKMDTNIKRINNILFVKCPNQVIEEKNKELKKQGKELLPVVKCSNCKACVNMKRQAVIVFVNHGTHKKRNDFLINL